MTIALKASHKTHSMSDNTFARKAFEEIRRIDEEATQKKMAQLESLKSARAAIMERINELEHQLTQIESVVGTVTGRPSVARVSESERKHWDEVRGRRIARWMQGRRGQKFGAADLVREFSELDGQPVSMILKPLIEAGSTKVDASAGPKRTKYFAEG